MRHLFGTKVTRIVKAGGGREGGIKDHSQLSVGAMGESMLSFSNKGETQGKVQETMEPKEIK